MLSQGLGASHKRWASCSCHSNLRHGEPHDREPPHSLTCRLHVQVVGCAQLWATLGGRKEPAARWPRSTRPSPACLRTPQVGVGVNARPSCRRDPRRPLAHPALGGASGRLGPHVDAVTGEAHELQLCCRCHILPLSQGTCLMLARTWTRLLAACSARSRRARPPMLPPRRQRGTVSTSSGRTCTSSSKRM